MNLTDEGVWREIKGTLYLRDGLPILDLDRKSSEILGYILEFHPSGSTQAYGRIVALELEKQYRGGTVLIQDRCVNVLVGKSPSRGSVPCEDEWDGKNDPLFTKALDVIEEQLNENLTCLLTFSSFVLHRVPAAWLL